MEEKPDNFDMDGFVDDEDRVISEIDKNDTKSNNPNTGGYDEHTIKKALQTLKVGHNYINCVNMMFRCVHSEGDTAGIMCGKHGLVVSCKYCPTCPVCSGNFNIDQTILISSEFLEAGACVQCGFREAGVRVPMYGAGEVVFGMRVSPRKDKIGNDENGVPYCSVIGCLSKCWDRRAVRGLTEDSEFVCHTHYERISRRRRTDESAVIRRGDGRLIDNPDVKFYKRRVRKRV